MGARMGLIGYGVRKDIAAQTIDERARTLSDQDVIFLVNDILTSTLDYTLEELESWINSRVPKDYGYLRANVIDFSKNQSNISNRGLKLTMGSDIEYAPYVNAMDTSKVRHNNVPFRGRILHDPEAVGHYHTEMVEEGEDILYGALEEIREEKLEAISK